MERFKGKTAVVTGGASGIGKGITQAFLAEGANVVMTCLEGEEAAKEFYDEVGGKNCALVECDISNRADVEKLVASAIEQFGKIDVFVSNAAAFDFYKPLLETTEETWDKVMDVNLKGNYYISQAILPHMIENNGGSLIFISSIAGLIAGHGGAAYTTSKHGIIGLCKQITFHYGNKGVRCNCICPGAIYTPLSAPFLDQQPAIDKLALTPYGTHGQPKHIAGAVLYLASEEGEFVHGTAMLIDGGNVVRKWL